MGTGAGRGDGLEGMCREEEEEGFDVCRRESVDSSFLVCRLVGDFLLFMVLDVTMAWCFYLLG
jgi:hypothetical protein